MSSKKQKARKIDAVEDTAGGESHVDSGASGSGSGSAEHEDGHAHKKSKKDKDKNKDKHKEKHVEASSSSSDHGTPASSSTASNGDVTVPKDESSSTSPDKNTGADSSSSSAPSKPDVPADVFGSGKPYTPHDSNAILAAMPEYFRRRNLKELRLAPAWRRLDLSKEGYVPQVFLGEDSKYAGFKVLLSWKCVGSKGFLGENGVYDLLTNPKTKKYGTSYYKGKGNYLSLTDRKLEFREAEFTCKPVPLGTPDKPHRTERAVLPDDVEEKYEKERKILEDEKEKLKPELVNDKSGRAKKRTEEIEKRLYELEMQLKSVAMIRKNPSLLDYDFESKQDALCLLQTTDAIASCYIDNIEVAKTDGKSQVLKLARDIAKARAEKKSLLDAKHGDYKTNDKETKKTRNKEMRKAMFDKARSLIGTPFFEHADGRDILRAFPGYYSIFPHEKTKEQREKEKAAKDGGKDGKKDEPAKKPEKKQKKDDDDEEEEEGGADEVTSDKGEISLKQAIFAYNHAPGTLCWSVTKKCWGVVKMNKEKDSNEEKPNFALTPHILENPEFLSAYNGEHPDFPGIKMAHLEMPMKLPNGKKIVPRQLGEGSVAAPVISINISTTGKLVLELEEVYVIPKKILEPKVYSGSRETNIEAAIEQSAELKSIADELSAMDEDDHKVVLKLAPSAQPKGPLLVTNGGKQPSMAAPQPKTEPDRARAEELQRAAQKAVDEMDED